MSRSRVLWGPLHADAPDHEKVWQLADVLGIPGYAAFGLVSSLWARGLKSKGEIFGRPHLQKITGWPGSAADLERAMVDVGIVDRGPNRSMRIHDFALYGARLIEEREAERSRKKRPIPPSLRFTVLERDGFACQYCGARPPKVALHVDHVVADSAGGPTSAENLVTSCEPCNLGKGARLLRVVG